MDQNLYPAIIVIVAVILFLVWSRKKAALKKKKEELRGFNKNQAGFLCDGADYLEENTIQLYGEAVGASIRPGMKVIGFSGREYFVKEVYASDAHPEKPDLEIPAGMKDTAIVIEMDNGGWAVFRAQLKKERAVFLRVL